MSSFISKNPFTRQLLKEIPASSFGEVQGTIEGLHSHFLKQKLSAEGKDQIQENLSSLAKGLEKEKSQLARMLTTEMGKPVKMAEAEVTKTVGHIHHYLENFDSYTSPKLVDVGGQKSGYRLDPLGVIYKITPFNFPIWIAMKMAIPTMVAGNSVYVRSANSTPQTFGLLQRVVEEAGVKTLAFGFPSAEDTDRILGLPEIQGVNFTGSTASGSAIASAAGKHLKKCALELGGNDPFIVFPDADLDLAVKIATKSRLLNSGQVCFSSKRFFIPEKQFKAFVHKLKEKIAEFKVGDPFDPETKLGPLARDELTSKYVDQLSRAAKGGDTVLLGNSKPDGNLVKPSIFKVKDFNSSVLTNEEVFGPCFSLIPYLDVEEAIKMANQTQYGLGATIITKKTEKALEYARIIDSGFVYINDAVTSASSLPAGGVKASGFGRDCGAQGVEYFSNIKTFHIAK